MEKLVEKFLNNISLTKAQRDDAKTKYEGVCKKLYSHYYSGDYDKNKQFLFGSYKTKTNVRPLDDMQDVDVLFKIPEETYEKYKDNPSGLLQDMRKTLKEKYTTTDKIKAWTKVVLVAFSDNHHNVEVLSGFEQEDGTFKIPDTSDGGSWEDNFDPRKQIDDFQTSNKATDGLTRRLVQMLKKWVRNTSTLQYSSYILISDVIDFLSDYYLEGKGEESYLEILRLFFEEGKSKHEEQKSHFEKAYNRIVKAQDLSDEGKKEKASEELKKIFGDDFPKGKDEEQKSTAKSIYAPASPWCY
jgi:hypothetical protein